MVTKFISNLGLDPLPIRHAFAGYGPDGIRRDVRAGVNGALLAFPQAIAYAMLAGLPIQYGIWCSAIAALVGPLFVSSRLTILGPTNATAVMMLSISLGMPQGAENAGVLALLVCMVGGLLIAGAFMQLAFLLRFISQSVIIGYICAAALLIIANQMQHVLGVEVDRGSTFLDIAKKTAVHLPETQWQSVVLAIFAFSIQMILQRRFKMWPGVAISLVLTACLAASMRWQGVEVGMVAALPDGHWPLTLPTLNFSTFQSLLGPAIALAFLAALENTIMAKTVASRTGTDLNPNQDLMGLGVANLASGLTSGMVASASPVRSSLNIDSNAFGPLSSIINGALCVAGALLLGSAIGLLPKAAVAAVVVGAAISLLDMRRVRVAWKSTRSDAVTLATTFIAALIAPLDTAIFIGVATSIALFLKKASAPQLIEYSFNDDGQLCEVEDRRSNPRISIIHAEGDLFFGASDLFRDEVRKVCKDPLLRVVVLRLRNAHHLDATTIFAIEDLIRYLQSTGRFLLISGARRDVYKIFRDTGVLDLLDKKNFFMGSPSNPNLATRKALKRAQELIGSEKADIQIYYDPNKKKREE